LIAENIYVTLLSLFHFQVRVCELGQLITQQGKDGKQTFQRTCKVVDASACFLIQVQDGYWAEKLVVGDSYIVHHPYINQLGVMVVYNGKNSVSSFHCITIYYSLC